MENTFNKLFELEKCSVRALHETIFYFMKDELWTRNLTTHDILNEQLSLWCLKPDRTIGFKEGVVDSNIELPFKMRTEKWELLVTVNWCFPRDDGGYLCFDGEWLTKFRMHCFKGDPKDLKTTFMMVKLTRDMDEVDVY